ncbi:hypothetical protein ACIGXM_10970 [Kitasatospora sp. NPDC052896]|uniref:hypothetical protein n=1 Tax=Kitasatospora sp. NPDC052896 TaxID=3364061 RepID=UPI0037C86487
MRNPENRVEYGPHALDGELAADAVTGRRGVVTGQAVEYSRWTGKAVRCEVFLRPVGGGVEWTVDDHDLRPVFGAA